MKLHQFLLTIFLGVQLLGARAQNCPAEVRAVTSPVDDNTEWGFRSRPETYSLAGMSLVRPPLNESDENFQGYPVPERRGENYFFSFRGPIESSEEWMRCFYGGTSLTLHIKIAPGVVECFVEKDAKRGKSNRVLVAACVKFRKYSMSQKT